MGNTREVFYHLRCYELRVGSYDGERRRIGFRNRSRGSDDTRTNHSEGVAHDRSSVGVLISHRRSSGETINTRAGRSRTVDTGTSRGGTDNVGGRCEIGVGRSGSNTGIGHGGVNDLGISRCGIDDVGISHRGIDDVGISHCGIDDAGIGHRGIDDVGISCHRFNDMGINGRVDDTGTGHSHGGDIRHVDISVEDIAIGADGTRWVYSG